MLPKAPADLRQRQPLAQKLLQRSAIHAPYCLRSRWSRVCQFPGNSAPILHRPPECPPPREPRLDGPMAGPVKTEAVVLRSMRYGEADRILHVYTPHRGRISAIAKGVRRTRSRFGGRLEPFFRLTAGPARGAQRPADGDGRADGRRLPPPARRRARAGQRRARLRRGRAPVRDRRAAPGRVQPAVPASGVC